jgi:hypothetical protein
VGADAAERGEIGGGVVWPSGRIAAVISREVFAVGRHFAFSVRSS